MFGLFEPIRDLLTDRNWFARVDKQALGKICGANRIDINELSVEGNESYRYVDAEKKISLFIVIRRQDGEWNAMRTFFGSPEKAQERARMIPDPKTIRFDTLAGFKTIYYENGKDKNLLAKGKRFLEFVTDRLTQPQLTEVVRHFADKKIL